MLKVGSSLFVQPATANPEDRALRAARVRARDGRHCEIEICEGISGLEIGGEFLAFFEAGGQFCQQSARLCELRCTGDDALISVDLVGQPASAEVRESFRISTASTGVKIVFAGEEGCPLLDVSAGGLSLISTKRRTLGTLHPVSVDLNGDTYVGEACVQSAIPTSSGLWRYGLRCVGDRRFRSSLQRGLERIGLLAHGERLERLRETILSASATWEAAHPAPQGASGRSAA